MTEAEVKISSGISSYTIALNSGRKRPQPVPAITILIIN